MKKFTLLLLALSLVLGSLTVSVGAAGTKKELDAPCGFSRRDSHFNEHRMKNQVLHALHGLMGSDASRPTIPLCGGKGEKSVAYGKGVAYIPITKARGITPRPVSV